MLFTCKICNFGHSALNVESFRDINTKRTVYLCKDHLSCRTPQMIHQPWADQDIWAGCNICSVGHVCYGLKQPGVDIKGTGKKFCISKSENKKGTISILEH